MSALFLNPKHGEPAGRAITGMNLSEVPEIVIKGLYLVVGLSRRSRRCSLPRCHKWPHDWFSSTCHLHMIKVVAGGLN